MNNKKGLILPSIILLVFLAFGVVSLIAAGDSGKAATNIFSKEKVGVHHTKLIVSPGEQIFVKNDDGKYNSCGLTATGTLEGRDIGITAGHCGEPGWDVYNSRSVVMGKIYENGFTHVSSGPSDWAIIDFGDNIEIKDDNKYSFGTPDVGDHVSFDGNATGESEGYVEDPGVIEYNLITDGYTAMTGRGVLTTAAVNPTDSGSPVRNSRNEITGLVSAATSSGEYGTGKMIMTTLEDILESFRVLKNEDLQIGGNGTE